MKTPPPPDPHTGDRYYQTRCVEMLREAIAKKKRRLLVVSPTGSGKMRVIARIMQLAASKGKRAGFAAHQRELVEQNEKTLEDLGAPCHVVMSGRDNEYHSAEEAEEAQMLPVMAKDTLWARTFGKRAHRNKKKMEAPDLDVLLFDEAHLSLAKTWTSIAKHYREAGAVLIGFTATPCRTDGKGLGSLYDEMITMATYKELQDFGYLVPLRIIAPTRPDLERLKVSQGDYVKRDLEQRMNKSQLIGDVVKTWMDRGEDRSTVVFASGVKHSQHLAQEFLRSGITAAHVDGKTDLQERWDIMAGARDGSIQVVCNYGVATMGVDVPVWKCLVCCRPTKSLGLWWQMAGRIQRPAGGYTDGLILDHSDNALVYGYPDEDVEWSLQSEGKVQESNVKKKKKESKAPSMCKKCGAVMRKGGVCSVCGHKSVVIHQSYRPNKGDLEVLDRKKRNRTQDLQSKQAYWDRLLGWAVANNRKIGAASYRYKDYFGVWPNQNLKNVPRTPTQMRMWAREFYDSVVRPERDRQRTLSEVLKGSTDTWDQF